MQTAIDSEKVQVMVKESMSSFAKMFGLPVSILLDNVDRFSNQGEYRNERLPSKQLQE